MSKGTSSRGFSVIEGFIILLVISLVGFSGWYVWRMNKKTEPVKQPSNIPTKTNDNIHGNQANKQVDPYEGWKTYNNTLYGISFKYPAEWKIDEGESNPSPGSLTRQEYSITLKRSEEVRYNATIIVEVLDMKPEEATGVYDSIFAQAPSNPVTKTTNQLKGRQSVQYAHSDERTSLYLFSFDSKTYLFKSINEWLSTQSDANYWNKFDKVFDSLSFDQLVAQ